MDATWYHDVFLQSPEWRETRSEVIARDGFQCRICGRKSDLQVHHRFYDDNDLCRQDALVTLCGTCHNSMHTVLKSYQKLHNEIGVIQYDDCKEFLAKSVLYFYQESFRPQRINILNAGYSIINRIGEEVCKNIEASYSFLIIKSCKNQDIICNVSDVNYKLLAQDMISKYQNIAIRQLLSAGKSDREIRSYLGMSEQSYRKRARKMG